MEWLDPDTQVLYKNKQLKKKYAAVSGLAYHKLFPDGREVIHTKGLEHINNKDWELISISLESEKNYWGMFVEGLGFFNVMFPKDQVRELTKKEIEYLKGVQFGMFGSHSGKLSYTFNLGIE